MGGIREKGFFINCDRCSKDREVTNEKQVEFYKKFQGRKERSVLMFNSLLQSPDGEKSAGFEWLCPDCVSAVATYLGKAAPEKDDTPKTGKARKGGKQQQPEAESADKAAEPGTVNDNDLFD